MASVSADFRHDTPVELRAVLNANPALDAKWQGLTDLGRNEWICWLTSPRKQETREEHLARLQKQVLEGKHRPCC